MHHSVKEPRAQHWFYTFHPKNTTPTVQHIGGSSMLLLGFGALKKWNNEEWGLSPESDISQKIVPWQLGEQQSETHIRSGKLMAKSGQNWGFGMAFPSPEPL